MLGPGRMDARTADSPVISQQQSWLQRERASGRFYDRIAWVIAVALAGIIGLSFWLLRGGSEVGTPLSPTVRRMTYRQLIAAIALRAV